MRVAVLAVTRRGVELGLRVSGALEKAGLESRVLAMPELAGEIPGAEPLEGPLGSAAGDLFEKYGSLVMIMAMGIVIRVLAPHIRDKRTDPAVVVMDEGGSFAISALSGHLGGANDLARLIAREIPGCTAVITTATDVNGVPAVDVLARDCKLAPDPHGAVKQVNAALARGQRVDLYSEYYLPLEETPSLAVRPWAQLGEGGGGAWRVLVTGRHPFPAGDRDLLLRPVNLVVGIGCKRGVAKEAVLDHVRAALGVAGRSPLCVRALATVEARASEVGLTGAARDMGVPLMTFGTGQLGESIERHGLQKSESVMDRIGVGGVCEPAAMLGCRKGRLLVEKMKGCGITVAVAEEESGWWESAPAPVT